MENIRKIIESVHIFTPQEIEIAVDLARERLAKGEQSGYYFVFAQDCEHTIGYICYGPIAGTRGSFDLYWVAVDKKFHRAGAGRKLLSHTEKLIATKGGRRIYIETSSRDVYEVARQFYIHLGYKEEAVVRDFYSPGDDKIIYIKEIS
ncbi:MAG: GNAT family N-acetyltransferase [bacterium]